MADPASKSASGYDVTACLEELKQMKQVKQPWLAQYETVAKLMLTRKQGFEGDMAPGAFIQDDLFDNTGQFALYLAASVLLAMQWPDASRSFTLRPARRLRKVKGADEYFRFATTEVQEAMDNPRAGLYPSLMEHFIEKLAFGISGIGAFEGPKTDKNLPVVFDAWGIKGMYVSENAQGFIDKIKFQKEVTVRQVYEEYDNDRDSIHPTVKEMYGRKEYEKKIKVLYVLEPKDSDENAAPDSEAAMECRSVHIDVERQFVMRTGAYHELPVFVSRFFKVIGEPYAYSPGMMAVPACANLNALRGDMLLASEKNLKPPLVVLDDGRLGGGVVDTSPNGMSVFNSSGRISNEKPVYPLYTVGEMQSSKDQAEQLREEILQHFFLDRLLDLNNETQMTAFETSVRARMRGEALGSVFARDEMETFTPLIQRVFNVLYRSGRLGIVQTGIGATLRRLWAKITGVDEIVVPPEIIAAAQAGLDVFEIEYISPAKRFMQSEKLQGIFTASDAIAALAAVVPGIEDNIHKDRTAAAIWKFAGAPAECLNTEEERNAIREEKASAQSQVEQVDSAKQGSEAVRNLAQARQAMGTTAQPTAGAK
jgi:hypothetical protein